MKNDIKYTIIMIIICLLTGFCIFYFGTKIQAKLRYSEQNEQIERIADSLERIEVILEENNRSGGFELNRTD